MVFNFVVIYFLFYMLKFKLSLSLYHYDMVTKLSLDRRVCVDWSVWSAGI